MVARCETSDDEWSLYFPDGVVSREEKSEAELLYDEIERYRDALSGLYGLCKLIYLGTEPAHEIRYHLATNHRSIAVARILGCDRIGNPERHPNGMR